MKLKNKLTFLLVCSSMSLLLGGCATITGNSMQQVCVDVRDQNNNPVKGAQCKLSNDKGTWFVRSPDTVMVHKSSSNLNIIAQKDGYDPATTSVPSKVGAGMFGNIIFGGVIGAVVDHSKGTAYNYPNNVSVTMCEEESAPRKGKTKSSNT